jgi:hypothetical protein
LTRLRLFTICAMIRLMSNPPSTQSFDRHVILKKAKLDGENHRCLTIDVLPRWQ